MIRYVDNHGNYTTPDVMKFPDGTLKITAPVQEDATSIKIIWQYEKEEELNILLYTAMNLMDRYNVKLSLVMPYLPNARMDRIHSNEEVFTLKHFCTLINMLGFEKVYVLDAHSSVGAGMLNRVENLSPEKYVQQALALAKIDPEKDYIFFPDEGSCKRYSSMFSGYKNIGFGIKKRDWATGKIEGLEIHGDSPEGRNVFIIDDICAYGGTVYYSAKELKDKGCNNITVFFTHCENSIEKGKLFTCGMIDHIYTTNSICTLNETEMLTIFDCIE